MTLWCSASVGTNVTLDAMTSRCPSIRDVETDGPCQRSARFQRTKRSPLPNGTQAPDVSREIPEQKLMSQTEFRRANREPRRLHKLRSQ